MRKYYIFIIIITMLFGIVFTTNAGKKIKDIIVGTLTTDALKIKKQMEVGGKIYLNGVISNKTKGRGRKDNPVRFSDNVEIKGNVTVSGTAPYMPSMTCANGEVPKYESSGWICGKDKDLLTYNCFNEGEILKWVGSKWVCGKDNDTNTDTDTLGSLICLRDQIIVWNGSKWVCGDDKDTDTDTDTLKNLSCSYNQIPKKSFYGWTCEDDKDALGDITLCSYDQIPYKKLGGSWACKDDSSKDIKDIKDFIDCVNNSSLFNTYIEKSDWSFCRSLHL